MTLEQACLPGILEGAMCVQRFDDSLNSAIHITYRISLRSSSMPEPRDPLLKVLIIIVLEILRHIIVTNRDSVDPLAGTASRSRGAEAGHRRSNKVIGSQRV